MLTYKILIEWRSGIAGRFVPLNIHVKRYVQDIYRIIDYKKEKKKLKTTRIPMTMK